MAEPHGATGHPIAMLDEKIDLCGSGGDAGLCRQRGEQLAELLLGRIADVDLVGNSPEEGFIHQFARFEVRRKNHELIEGHLNLAAAPHGQKIVTLFERHDPPVQQLGWRDPLAAKIVDDENAAIALQLQRRLADAACAVRADFEAFQGQFAPDDNRGPPDAHPPRVDFLVLDDAAAIDHWQLDVHRRIVKSNDLAKRVERPRDPNAHPVRLRDPFGDAAFSIAGTAVQKQSFAGTDRSADFLQHGIAKIEIAESFGDLCGLHF